MNKEEAIQTLLSAGIYFDQQSTGYKSWGKVEVLRIAIRLDNNEIISTERNKSLSALTKEDILTENGHSVFRQIFDKRKKVSVVLFTQQEFASQVKTEIPPILDDQAQLLGVSVRIARSENDILNVLSGRFAGILSDGKSICLGSSLEEAYVAAQLLEKTSKAFVEAEYLGGAKAINKIEAWLMQQFYLFKYSKEAKRNK